MMVILGSAWSPVLVWRYTETITSRHCTLGNSMAMNPHPSTQKLDQARVGLPGCGNHKTPFVVVGLRGTGPKGMKPLTEKGGLCLRLLLKAEVRLLRKETGRLGVLAASTW